jgi:hypothetical protein
MERRVRYSSDQKVPTNAVCEVEFTAATTPADPWSAIDLDIDVTDPDGVVHTVPAFWAGGRSWVLRYSSPLAGEHRYVARVSRGTDAGLDGASGSITIAGYRGANPLLRRGGPRVSDDATHLSHGDGSPFFWLGDTWWAGMAGRFRWPDVFQNLTADRAEKGFTVVQIVAGLVPEFVPFSDEMASEGGQPWLDHGRGTINPAYYDVPDVKIDHLVENGIVPCIVGGWGLWARVLGREKILQHWRYLVARFGAYPVVWCIAGEVDGVSGWEAMGRLREIDDPHVALGELGNAAVDLSDPWTRTRESFMADDVQKAAFDQVGIWEDAAKLVGRIDPFHRIRTLHTIPPLFSTDVFADRGSVDLDMQQAGHLMVDVPLAIEYLEKARSHGDKPVLVGEVSYEGIFGSAWDDLQRFHFWSRMLSGAAGHTYGTMALSTFSMRDEPYMPLSHVSQHHYEDALEWRGAASMGAGRRILERFAWQGLEPAPDAIEPAAGDGNRYANYAARLPGDTLVIYRPTLEIVAIGNHIERGRPESPGMDWVAKLAVVGLTPGVEYRVVYIDPTTGEDHSSFRFTAASDRYDFAAASGIRVAPTMADWVIVIRPVVAMYTEPGS